MIVHCYSIGQLKTNCYFAVCPKTDQAVIIDPADEGDFLSEKILSLKIKPLQIVLTHAHFDHLLAAEELRLNFKIPISLHQKDIFLLKKAGQSADYWLGSKEKYLLPKKWQLLQEDEVINFGQEKMRVIHVPGHTPGSLAFYEPKDSLLFSGDLLFKEGVGRSDFNYSSEQQLHASLKKIFRLPAKTLVYPGHDEEFILKSVVKYYHGNSS